MPPMLRALRWHLVLLALALLTLAASLAVAQAGEGPDGAPEQAGAPAETPAVPPELATPRAAVEGFLEAYSSWRAARTSEQAQRMLRFMPAGVRDALDQAGTKSAAMLGEVLIELRERDVFGGSLDAPEGATRFDYRLRLPGVSLGGVGPSVSFPLEKGAEGAWRFTTDAVDLAVDLHAQLFSERSEYWLRNLFIDIGAEGMVTDGLLGLRYYQWISLFALILLAVILDHIVRLIVAIVSRRFLKREDDAKTGGDTPELIRKAARPFGLVMGGVFVYLALPILQIPAQAEGVLLVAAKTFALIAGLWAAFKVVDLLAEWLERRAAGTATKVDDLLVPLVRRAVKIFMLAFGLIFIAESLNLPIASLVAGFGIAGAAVAFAAKDTVENLFGSVAVILDRPFHVGDWVVIGDTEGIVEDLGFRSTRIRTFYNSLVTVPNATLVRATVDNYGRRAFRRFSTRLNVTYDTPPDRIESFCEGIREIIRQHPRTRKDFFEVHMNAFGPHSLDILVYMFFLVPDWSTELRERHRFCLDILRLAQRLGVDFAFPTQTIHLSRGDPPERNGEPGPGPGGRQPEDEARDTGKRLADEIMSDAEFRRAAGPA